MQGNMPRQPVEGLDEAEKGIELATRGKPAEAGVAQLRQIGERCARIAGTNMRERLGE